MALWVVVGAAALTAIRLAPGLESRGQVQPAPTTSLSPALGRTTSQPASRPALAGRKDPTLPGLLVGDGPDTTALMWQMLGTVVVILVLGGAAMVLARRLFSRGPAGSGRRVRLLESTPLGMRRNVHLLEVGARRLLVGDTKDGLVMLADVTDALVAADAPAEKGGPAEQ